MPAPAAPPGQAEDREQRIAALRIRLHETAGQIRSAADSRGHQRHRVHQLPRQDDDPRRTAIRGGRRPSRRLRHRIPRRRRIPVRLCRAHRPRRGSTRRRSDHRPCGHRPGPRYGHGRGPPRPSRSTPPRPSTRSSGNSKLSTDPHRPNASHWDQHPGALETVKPPLKPNYQRSVGPKHWRGQRFPPHQPLQNPITRVS
jgi:hypothetical protein